MCGTDAVIVETQNLHRDCAKIPGVPREVELIHLYLAIELEKLRRRHARHCAECAAADLVRPWRLLLVGTQARKPGA
jgi:hypothetical protein